MIKVEFLVKSLEKHKEKLFDFDWMKNYKYELHEFLEDMKFVEEFNYDIIEWSVLLKDFMVRCLGCDINDLELYKRIIGDAYIMYIDKDKIDLDLYFKKDQSVTVKQGENIVLYGYYKTTLEKLINKYENDDNVGYSYHYEDDLGYIVSDWRK